MNKILIYKELKDFLRNKTFFIFSILLFFMIAYSFFSAVDLYSKASVSALNNPLYAVGFEPVQGVFVPTFGGIFILLSLIAPFLFIQSISNEKKYNTISLIAQFPISLFKVFTSKFVSATILLLLFLSFLIPTIFLWINLGGHIAIAEIFLLFLGYFLYGTLVVSVSFFFSSIFSNSSQASISTLFFLISSWFIDFGKDMNILSFFKNISNFTLTKQLKFFENGILSFQAIFYFLILIYLFFALGYLFFNFTIRNKFKYILVNSAIFIILFSLNTKTHLNFDLTESKRNSFSPNITKFLKRLPPIHIKIFLEPTDSRAIDYKNDFLKKLSLIKSNLTIEYASKKELKENYGFFKYTINNKSEKTLSNSEEEIFMIFEELAKTKLKPAKNDDKFQGFPLVVKKRWSFLLFIIYLLFLPFIIVFLYFFIQKFHRRKYYEKD